MNLLGEFGINDERGKLLSMKKSTRWIWNQTESSRKIMVFEKETSIEGNS